MAGFWREYCWNMELFFEDDLEDVGHKDGGLDNDI